MKSKSLDKAADQKKSHDRLHPEAIDSCLGQFYEDK